MTLPRRSAKGFEGQVTLETRHAATLFCGMMTRGSSGKRGGGNDEIFTSMLLRMFSLFNGLNYVAVSWEGRIRRG